MATNPHRADSASRERLRVWQGPSLLTDSREEATTPQRISGGFHALGGFEIPFLPEPFEASSIGAGERENHRTRIIHEMSRMVYGLHIPEADYGDASSRLVGFPTFDFRIVSKPGVAGPGQLRLFLLVKIFVPVEGLTDREEARELACSRALEACRLCRAVAPPLLTLEPLRFWDGSFSDTLVEGQVGDSMLGLVEFEHLGELRREHHSSKLRPRGDFHDFCAFLRNEIEQEGMEGEPLYSAPYFWPDSSHDLLPTCGVLAASPNPVVLSVRLQPTSRTPREHRALLQRQGELFSELKDFEVNTKRLGRTGLEQVWLLLGEHIAQRELFQISIQVGSDSKGAVDDVLATLASEQVPNHPIEQVPTDRRRQFPIRSRPSRSRCLHENETRIANFNLTNLEFWPWGGIDDRARDAARPSGSIPLEGNAPNLNTYVDPEEARSPEAFLQRDWEAEPHLTRWRSLVSLAEASSILRLPIVGAGGQAGLASRLPNPFEQLPSRTLSNEDTVSLGFVRHRGTDTQRDYRVPLTKSQGGYTAVGDRVIVVAGSPGSGKTNFCLHFLGQLWGEGRRHPFLVIDPTRGMEFRALRKSARDDLVVFTVGDSREVPFCFNPFVVPANVSVQGHISRLMSCFRAAYHMWDPLPAIFEESLRLAYQRKFESLGKPWDPACTFGTGELGDYPTLSDVCRAMGTGDDHEKDTVLARMSQLWSAGGTVTENQATIRASTSLRLQNLKTNFDHIIGGPKEGRLCVDLNELLKVPAVLELGMIGDSQALSLTMAFLVVSLAGCIENRDRSETPMHMLVLEEAHQLLSAESGQSLEGSRSQAQAAEDINKLLAEVRKYGQGVMLLDQRPGSLVGGVIDNAYLVALHRLNERKSFEQFADMLNLNPSQQRFARVGLQPGEAVFLDHPSQVPVTLRPPAFEKARADEEDVSVPIDQMRKRASRLHFGESSELSARAREFLSLCQEGKKAADLRRLSGEIEQPEINAGRVRRMLRTMLHDLGASASEQDDLALELCVHLARESSRDEATLRRLRQEFRND